MSVITSVIQVGEDGSLSFGNYKVKEKQKVNDFEVSGNIYKVKTHDEITRIEKNGKLLLESVPGTSVHHFLLYEKVVRFSIGGFEDTQITMELEPEKEYRIFIDDVNVGTTNSNRSGKISFSMGLSDTLQKVKIEKFE